MSEFFKGWRRKIGVVPPMLAILAICAVLYAILAATPQWASDGTIRIPVRIFAFDAANHRPIPNAKCLIFRATPVSNASSLTNDHAIFNGQSMNEWPQFCRGTTDATGSTIIEHEFGTSASHEHPNPHAHLMNYSVQVEADGFGGVVVPVGNDERRTSEIRKDGEVVVSIGLLRTE